MSNPRHVAVALIYSPTTGRLLMVSSRKHPKLWIFPKGGVEKGETSGQAAVREAWEEAGSPSDFPPPADEERIAQLALDSGKGHHRGSVWHVHMIPVEEAAVDAITEWPERHERMREWVLPDECLRRIRAWWSDSDALARRGGPATEQERKAAKKKDIKGEAMELAVRAFADRTGLVLPP